MKAKKLTSSVIITYVIFTIFTFDIAFSQEFTPDANTVGLWHFNEGSGTIANDASGNENHGQITGASWTTEGKFGNALSFDDDGDGVQINSPFSGIQNVFTIELYFKVNQNFNGRRLFRHRGDYRDVDINFPQNNIISFSFYDVNSTAHEIFSQTQVSLNTWYHLAAIYDGQEMRLYLNGVLESSKSVTANVSWSENYKRTDIGDSPSDTHAEMSFNGIIDEVRISDIARYGGEFTPDINTILYWQFNDGNGTSCIDESGRNHNGTIQNAQWIDSALSSFGKALHFVKSGSYAMVAHHSDFDFGMGSFTIEAWVRTSNQNDNRIACYGPPSGASAGWFFNINGGKLTFSLETDGGIESDENTWADDQWHHLAAFRDSQRKKLVLWADGKIIKEVDDPNPNFSIPTNCHFVVGGHHSLSGSGDQYDYMEGDIDEIRLSNIARYITTSVDRFGFHSVPNIYHLFQNFPNPFNPTTTISFILPFNQSVKIEIVDILGRQVSSVFEGVANQGLNSVTFDASILPSGLYFYKLKTDNSISVRKMSVLR